ncbi:MAG TPA: flagellar hook capping FlgD N-terminal domain-containing protein [Clostridia bacterium]|nr:flagellar hook capping FlgD N-terminal domain-containing protein [Clostridia bacterium]
MPTDPITSATNTWPVADGSTRLPAKTLNQDDFLRLLVAQLSSQDPMNPQSNADFAAQMAQFSALQTSQTTESELAKLRSEQQVLQANSLIGRAVTLDDGDGGTATGTVTAVQFLAGTPRLLVNGVPYALNQVLTIQAPQPATVP